MHRCSDCKALSLLSKLPGLQCDEIISDPKLLDVCQRVFVCVIVLASTVIDVRMYNIIQHLYMDMLPAAIDLCFFGLSEDINALKSSQFRSTARNSSGIHRFCIPCSSVKNL